MAKENGAFYNQTLLKMRKEWEDSGSPGGCCGICCQPITGEPGKYVHTATGRDQCERVIKEEGIG